MPNILAGSIADEQQALSNLVDSFSQDMRIRLKDKAAEGFVGWDNDNWDILGAMSRCLGELARGELDGVETERKLVDLANFAMFGWHRVREA